MSYDRVLPVNKSSESEAVITLVILAVVYRIYFCDLFYCNIHGS